ncbi:glycosyltransferase family 2 protein [uncultured Cellulomonas sp.]|uniref:glycosyltransferase family 2 protein n=1 Tax=uncultured Cellulomonas sp. TaxID=189682 RepID=UPI002605931F|nr:glycosyltransferase family 2 protein [uncultured Cellulomonas sp.]
MQDTRIPDLEIVVVAYRGLGVLRRCLDSLAEHVLGEHRVVVHVVDNCSGDGTPDRVEQEYPWVRLHRRAGNDGFAVANNAVLRDVTAPYVLVLNPDTELRAGVLPHLLDLLGSRPDIGMVGCRLEQSDGTFDHAAKRSFPSALQALQYFLGRSGSAGGYRAPHVPERGLDRVDAVNGAFMLVRTAAMREVGLFDERYWMYGEDLDWCRRFADAGWPVWYDGRVTAVHLKGGVSGKHRSPKLNWHFHRSMAIFYATYDGGRNLAADAAVYAGIAARFVLLAGVSAAHRRRSRQRPDAGRLVPAVAGR